MEAAGFALRVDDPDFVRRTRILPFVHESTAMPLDVVLAGSGLEDEFLDRAKPTDLGGTTVPLIEREDLVIAKVLAGRPQDMEDARGCGASTVQPSMRDESGEFSGFSRRP